MIKWLVLCKNGKPHKLKTVHTRQRAKDFVDYYNYMQKPTPKCGPHRVGKGK